jgi:hypothetical protein
MIINSARNYYSIGNSLTAFAFSIVASSQEYGCTKSVYLPDGNIRLTAVEMGFLGTCLDP